MFLFIDSSVICSDYFMKGINFNLIKKAGFYIVLSEIVISEVKNKYRESLQEGIKKANSALKDIKSLGLDVNEITDESLDIAFNEYSEFLDMFVIESGMSCPEPYPNISHKDIVNRALLRKKPFKRDGKNGYRDYLVWHTFLEFFGVTGNITDYYFLTLNHSDFSDDSDRKKFHPDLQEEINALKIGDKRVHYYSTLRDFVEEVITPMLVHIEDDERISELLMNSEEMFVFPISRFIESELNNLDIAQYEIPFWGDNPEVIEIADIEIEDIESISKTSENEYRVQLRADAFIIFDSYIKKSELASLSKRELKYINISNSNCNEHYASIENDVNLDIDIEVLLTITESEINVLAIEIDNISDSSYCLYCPDYDEEDEDEEN